MQPAVIVVDMIRDNLHGANPMVSRARALLPGINTLLEAARQRFWLVVFACDSFRPDDFFFNSRLKPHALEGTPGCEVAAELTRHDGDLVLPKRRLSAFFGTDLHEKLKDHGIDTVLVCGITTPFCVLTTTLDALCHDFAAVIVEDCCTAASPETHEATLAAYRKSALHPLLRVLTLDETLATF